MICGGCRGFPSATGLAGDFRDRMISEGSRERRDWGRAANPGELPPPWWWSVPPKKPDAESCSNGLYLTVAEALCTPCRVAFAIFSGLFDDPALTPPTLSLAPPAPLPRLLGSPLPALPLAPVPSCLLEPPPRPSPGASCRCLNSRGPRGRGSQGGGTTVSARQRAHPDKTSRRAAEGGPAPAPAPPRPQPLSAAHRPPEAFAVSNMRAQVKGGQDSRCKGGRGRARVRAAGRGPSRAPGPTGTRPPEPPRSREARAPPARALRAASRGERKRGGGVALAGISLSCRDGGRGAIPPHAHTPAPELLFERRGTAGGCWTVSGGVRGGGAGAGVLAGGTARMNVRMNW